MIESGDIDRLLTEITERFEASTANDPVSEWATENEFPDDVLAQIGDDLTKLTFAVTLEQVGEGKNPREEFSHNLASTILLAFIMGYEAHAQYGKPLTTP